MVGARQNTGGTNVPPSIETLSAPPMNGFVPPQKPDRIYDQCDTDSSTVAAETKLETLRQDTENSEVYNIVTDLARAKAAQPSTVSTNSDSDSDSPYMHLHRALESSLSQIAKPFQTNATAKPTAKTSGKVGTSAPARYNGLFDNQAPLSDINEIFDSITARAMDLGLEEAQEEFLDDKAGIRIVTMCSGTESPIIAMNMVQQALQRQGKSYFKIRHLGSCEIEPYKQAFIERNFGPPVLFRDVTEFTEHNAHPNDRDKRPRTAYGATAEIPEGVHILIAGSSCVDHSSLNNHANKVDGESAQTLLGVADYADRYRPVIVLLENVATADWEDQHTFWEKRNYYFRAVKVDSKNYYMPQTRERGYSFAVDKLRVGKLIDVEGLCSSECECDYQDCDEEREIRVIRFCEILYWKWENCMREFQRRASSPYTDFLLKEDDARLQAAKAMTESTKPNKQSSDWVKCQKRHTRVRAEDLLGTKRPFTNREGNGHSRLSDPAWQSWVRGQTLREQDVLDISALRYSSKRDLDMRFKARNIDISQNVDRDTDTRAWGLVGCITPKGTLFDTRRGGPIVGLEVLALQGMPIDNLNLTKASLRQLQDLAGNAMTTTVIGSSILSTLIVCRYKYPTANGQEETLFQEYTNEYWGHDVDKVGALGYEFVPVEEFSQLKKSGRLEKLNINPPASSLWKTIVNDARISQRLCLCESLGQHTTAVVKHCRKCSYTSCENCSRSPHDEFEALVLDHEDRGATDAFISKLTQYLPGVLRFLLSNVEFKQFSAISKTVEPDHVKIVNEALKNELQFQGVKYEETWKAIYESQTARLELEFVRDTQEQSKVPTSNPRFPHCLGVRPVWLLFAKCPSETPANAHVRKWVKHPIARMYPKSNCFDGVWEFWKGYKKDLNINIKSVGALKEAWEAKLGLQGHFYPKLQIFDQLEVKFDNSHNEDAKALKQLEGTYTLLEECPAPYGWLYVRDNLAAPQDASVFFYLNADPVHEAIEDRMEFGTRAPNLSSTDDRNLLLRLEGRYLPTVTESDTGSNPKKVKGWLASRWTAVKGVAIKAVDAPAEFYVQPKSSVFTHFENCEQSSSTVLLAKIPFRKELCQFPKDKAIKLQLEGKPGVLKHFKWMVGSVAMIPELDGDWHQMSSSFDGAQCFTCVPKAPALQWVELELDDDKKKQSKQKLVEDAQAAKNYEQAMKQRPVPVSAIIHRKQDEVCLQIQINVLALMHRAAAELAPAGGNLVLEWRLSRHPPFAVRPKFNSLKLQSNSSMEPAKSEKDGNGRWLWLSQRKTLAWMINMEKSPAEWNEEILKEACIPSFGWRLEAKASRNPKVRGGVLADKVGAGKTTTTLELVRQDLNRATMPLFPHDRLETHISTEATLILVPNNLMNQWKTAISDLMGKDFMKHDCLLLKNAKDLTSTTIADIKKRKIILVPLSLFEDEKYWEHHRMVACAPNVPEKAGRAFDEYLEDSLRNLASITKAFSNGDNETAFWGKWGEAKGLIGDYIRFSGVKTRASKKAQIAKSRSNTKTAGSQKRALSASQGLGNGPPLKKAKVASATTTTSGQASTATNSTTTSSATKKEWVLVSNDAFEMGEKVRFDEDAADFERSGVIIPVLHMFNFRRLIIDEFTYAQGITLAALLRMKATSRWLLSGTPPIHDYDSVNTMAKLLGTTLSVVDEKDGVHGFVKGLSRDSKLKSLSEEFREHQDIGSPAFIEYLHNRARKFSEEFIRQDECSEPKKGKSHELCPFRGSISERLDYAELEQTLETEDCRFNVKMDPKKPKGTTAKEIRQECRQSRSGSRAALVCSMSDLESSQQASGVTATNDPEKIADAEGDKILEHCLTLLDELRQLWYCKQNAYENYAKQSFIAFLANLSNLAVLDLDPSVVPIVDHLVSYAKAHPQAPVSTLDPPKKMTAKAEKENKAYKDNIAAAVIAKDAFKMLLPTYQAKEMDERTTKAERLIEEIVAGFRRRRFIQFAKDINQGNPPGTCSHCGNDVGTRDNAEISAGCGHIIYCSNCTDPSPTADNCMDKYCTAFIGHKWSADFFAQDPDADPSRGINVTRMWKAVDIIKAVPDEKEFFLVFVQYRNMAEQFFDACKKKGIKYADATDSKQSSKTIEEFREAAQVAQKAKGRIKTAAKVLLLQIDSEDAAGWNLQCANHVIFLAPFVGESGVHAWDTMVQAVGRAHRPGQKNDVKVYHIYAADTIEAEMVTTVKERFEAAE